MIRKPLSGIVLSVVIIACAGSARAITCDECKEIAKNKASLEHSIAAKELDIKKAFDQKKFHDVTEIRKQLAELRKSVVELQKKEVGCTDACRPDVIREAECAALRSQITQLEEDTSADVARVDALYRELANCNKELDKLKKSR